MSTSARRCAGCGGPLPQTPPSQRQIACPFCGIVNDLTHAPEPQQVTINVDVGDVGKVAASIGRKIKLAVIIGVFIAAGVVAWGLLQAVKPARQAIATFTEEAKKIDERNRPIEPVELAKVSERGGWREIKAPAPASAWNAFDPVANISWATAIARAWQPDARLERIDVSRASLAGTLDLEGEGENLAGYRFLSPAKIDEWARIADREANAGVPYGMMLNIAKRKVIALVHHGRPPSRDLPPEALETRPLGELIATAIRGGKFAEFPFYNGYVIHLEREGWVWYLQSLSRRDSLPRVRARDGATYPYPR